MSGLVSQCYLVPGQPHILLAPEKSKAWQSLRDAYEEVRLDLEKQDADLILYMSTQWLSVIGSLFQADPEPEWLHVDPNWHDLGSIPYKFKIDTDFSQAYCQEFKAIGEQAATVNYRGFPIDTGTIVAQKLLNPDNRLPAAMVSCNMYYEKAKIVALGKAATRALASTGKKAVVVLVSNLSNRYHTDDIDPQNDDLSSAKDHEWNLKIVELLGEGRMEDVAQCTREFAKEANADMGFKGLWWMNALCGEHNDFNGKVYGYGPVWGTGNALISLSPTQAISADHAAAESVQEYLEIAEKGQAAVVDTLDTNPQASSATVTPPPRKKESPAASAEVNSQKAPEPVGAYPHARRDGDRLFLSGVGPRQRGSQEIPGVTFNAQREVIDHDIEAQTRAVIENVKTILEESGSSLEKVVDVQVFLTDMKQDFAGFNKVYAEYFKEIGPTRTTIGIDALPTPINVELKVIAQA